MTCNNDTYDDGAYRHNNFVEQITKGKQIHRYFGRDSVSRPKFEKEGHADYKVWRRSKEW
jgi:hypothetical protein